jgi:hypothetical protein
MAVDQNGNVFVTGDTAATCIGALTDYATVAYRQQACRCGPIVTMGRRTGMTLRLRGG